MVWYVGCRWELEGCQYFAFSFKNYFQHDLCSPFCCIPQQAWQGGQGCPLDKWETRHRMWVPGQGHLQSPEEISCRSRDESSWSVAPGVKSQRKAGLDLLQAAREVSCSWEVSETVTLPPEGPYFPKVSFENSPQPPGRFRIWFGVRERMLESFWHKRRKQKGEEKREGI